MNEGIERGICYGVFEKHPALPPGMVDLQRWQSQGIMQN